MKTIIDIGACKGEFIDDCLLESVDIKLYAFEPLGANYDFLVAKCKDNSNVEIVKAAVSNIDGMARFYKKKTKRGYDVIGNAGSSLYAKKSNVSSSHYEEVNVVKLSKFAKDKGLTRIDVVKIDGEGSEYDIFDDIFSSGLYKAIDLFLFEDHCRKIEGLEAKKSEFLKQVYILEIQSRFKIQVDAHRYVNMESAIKDNRY